MKQLNTNRDLYLALNELLQTRKNSQPPLETYLRSFLGLMEKHASLASLPLSDFFNLISDSIAAEPIAFDPIWYEQYMELRSIESKDFSACRAMLIMQIVDLYEMKQVGVFENPHRFYGIDSPRGRRWYNFTTTGYLECASAGAIGGWEPRDDTGRVMLPGPVSVIDENGHVSCVDSDHVDFKRNELESISWEQVWNFLFCGQIYE